MKRKSTKPPKRWVPQTDEVMRKIWPRYGERRLTRVGGTATTTGGGVTTVDAERLLQKRHVQDHIAGFQKLDPTPRP